MGIYLPNMEMPQNCICCDLSHEDGWCPAKQTFTDRYTFETCPLVHVPPHGRLGDLDEINEKHDKLSRDFCHGYFKSTWDFVCAARKIFYDAPTIIPAEEGEG